MKDTTIRINADIRETLKDGAFRISMAKGEMISMSEVLRYVVENYTSIALDEMEKEIRLKNSQKKD